MEILLTGASGFLGNIIFRTLSSQKILTIGRKTGDIVCDLSLEVPKLQKFDIIIHASGLAHFVPKTDRDSDLFFNVNVNGTKNLLTGLEKLTTLPKSFVFISSVSVYGLDKGVLINENAPLNATDPYGLSKIYAENIVSSWCKKNSVRCLILRLPLIASVNPKGNLRSMINGIKNGYYFNISGNKARKSIVLAEEVSNIILNAAEIGGIYNLTDGYHPSFIELSGMIADQLHRNKPYVIPFWLAYFMSKIGDVIGSKAPVNTYKLLKITSTLTFDDSKARIKLGWRPTSVLNNFKLEE